MSKNNPPVQDGFDALQQNGKFHIRRDVRLEIFYLRDVADAEHAMQMFLKGLSDPGWDVTVMMGDSMHVTIVAVKETPEQDV